MVEIQVLGVGFEVYWERVLMVTYKGWVKILTNRMPSVRNPVVCLKDTVGIHIDRCITIYKINVK